MSSVRRRSARDVWFFTLAIFTLTLVINAITPMININRARYLIPLAGMLLGNCMNGNILSLERFYSGLRKNEATFLSYLLMGATLKEAVVQLKAAYEPGRHTILVFDEAYRLVGVPCCRNPGSSTSLR